MKMLYNNPEALAGLVQAQSDLRGRFVGDAKFKLSLSEADVSGRLRGDPASFSGRSIMIRTREQLSAVLALLALDGIARRLLLCPPDVPDEYIPQLMSDGEAEITITDSDINFESACALESSSKQMPRFNTDWVLFTSGTSGVPKLVLHSLASLTVPLSDGLTSGPAVWSTFYDIRRYGGLQILLRALICGGSMVLSDADEPVGAFLARLGREGVTHISGTPSHWRRALMSGAADEIAPGYIRLSGEMAGQDILDRLRTAYPQAKLGHAYASTEAGVAFSVNDGMAGFPGTVLEAAPPQPQIRIQDGTLRIRSNAAAARYLGKVPRILLDEDGFVDTGDVVERSGERYVFVGRREGVVNIGGLKVHPEEVEASINRHPAVAMSRVWGRPSPITGTLIAADIVLVPQADDGGRAFEEIRNEIIASCREALAPHKVPVRLNLVSEIPVMKSGKIARRHA